MIKEYLKDSILITDGAMGTYYSHITGSETTISELSNKQNPELIKGIHKEYIEAGAKLIRTNTFSANSFTLGISRQDIKELIAAGYEIAKSAAKDHDVFVAASIGPIPELVEGKILEKDAILDEYLFIANSFLNLGANIFIFETFSSTEYIKEVSEYIKSINPKAFILTQFALNTNGFTRKGISARRIQKQIKQVDSVDAYGFNCGIGPTHLYNIIKKLDFSKDIVSALPNSGYPVIINERTVYQQNPGYFAQKLIDIKDLGVGIIGGCCGTTPLHIKALAQELDMQPVDPVIITKPDIRKEMKPPVYPNTFAEKLKNNEFTIAVELDPPYGTNLEKMIKGARELKDGGVDILTIADSPMARVRTDSVMTAAKIKREVGIDVMPHICCRDKNIIALKSSLLAAHIEGIRNLLLVTGDPVPSPERNDIKSVFNLNSIKLIEMVTEMNKEVFAHEPYFLGGALNLNVLNKDVEIRRMELKAEKGAKFFLTQPIFYDNVIEYLKKIKNHYSVKILAGIIPLVSYRNAMFLNNEVPGIDISPEYIQRFSPHMSRQEAEDVGIDIAVELITKIKDHVDGIYLITPFNRTSMIAKIIKKSLQ
ncbi:MAG: bifunctional homocysteine S-methyltransferase/methylenetetrahydrofolate reductase [Clostridiales bacterium]|nr:bifunctional homocysteine S-methyltransferase/methylenetetrahydrofolate reductase [Clostridiales bacterium]